MDPRIHSEIDRAPGSRGRDGANGPTVEQQMRGQLRRTEIQDHRKEPDENSDRIAQDLHGPAQRAFATGTTNAPRECVQTSSTSTRKRSVPGIAWSAGNRMRHASTSEK